MLKNILVCCHSRELGQNFSKFYNELLTINLENIYGSIISIVYEIVNAYYFFLLLICAQAIGNSAIKSKFSSPKFVACLITLLLIVPGEAIPINSISFKSTFDSSITLFSNSIIIFTILSFTFTLSSLVKFLSSIFNIIPFVY